MSKHIEELAHRIKERISAEYLENKHIQANRELMTLGADVTDYAGLTLEEKIKLIGLLKQ